MKKRFTRILAALALLVGLTIPMGMWGQTNTAAFAPSNFSGQGTSGTGSAISATVDGVTFACDKGYGTTQIRCYSGGTITISSSNTITAITFTFSGSYTGGMETSYTDLSATSWTQTLSSQARITACSVSYTGGDTPQPTTYTVTFDAGDGTFAGNTDFPNASNTVAAGTYTLPSATPAEGYVFNGWVLGESTYEGGASYTVSGNADFVASYTENTTPTPGGETATLNIEAYAVDNNWVNGTKYATATVSPVTFTANGGGNTGKYYTSGEEWRFYQSENASITISVAEGYTLVSVKPIYTVSNSGILKNGDANIASGSTVEVSGTSVTFTVGNSGTATNGQVRFTNIDVVYVSDGSTQTVTVTPSTINAPAEGDDGTLALAYENITDFISFDFYFCDAEGNELEDTDPNYPDWIDAEIQEENETYSLYYVIGANDGDARTAYIKVYTFDDELEEVYAIVTVNQAKYVADYATLPFEFDGGKADIETTNGLTQTGLGTDFGSSPKLKFDTQDDNLVLKINEAPGVLTFDIKGTGNSGDWSGTFVVQASADGSTYTNIATYTDLTCNETEGKTIDNLASNVRYIRWYFSEKASGYNVALGKINLAAVPAGYPLTINGYGTSTGGYVLIASPISTTPVAAGMITDELGTNVTPETSTYDLYSYVQSEELEWRNYRANSFELVPGKGYLYASKNGVTLYFDGEMSTGFTDVNLPYDADDFTKSIYLAGNSLTEDQTFYVYDGDFALQTVNYITLNGEGSAFVVDQADSYTASALQGFFVQAAGSGWTLSTAELSGAPSNQGASLLNINVMRNRGTVIDNAIVSFSNGSMMNKFYLNDNTTRVYIPQGNREMAVVNSAAEAEMPVSFRASENGTYTLAVETENVDMNYLHLIDNMTGMDIDLLQTPSYTFEANTNDYANRFKLVFAANGTDEADESSFAFFSNGNLIVNNEGNATLQVIDINGRILSSETISGSCSKAINATTGVYMLRLINGDNVKVQKVVVR